MDTSTWQEILAAVAAALVAAVVAAIKKHLRAKQAEQDRDDAEAIARKGHEAGDAATQLAMRREAKRRPTNRLKDLED